MNITLIGLPAAGKTTLGQRLAKDLNWNFVDFDNIIIERHDLLKEIIKKHGEKKFLEIEKRIICEASGDKTVFSPGGSVIFIPDAMKHLKSISKVVYLKMTLDVLKKRTTNPVGRGVVGGGRLTLDQIYEMRHPLCEKYADHIVFCNKDDDELQYNLLRTFIKKTFSI